MGIGEDLITYIAAEESCDFTWGRDGGIHPIIGLCPHRGSHATILNITNILIMGSHMGGCLLVLSNSNSGFHLFLLAFRYYYWRLEPISVCEYRLGVD